MLPIRTTWQLNPAHGKRNGGEGWWDGGRSKYGVGVGCKETEEERRKKSDLVAASFEAELNWQEQLIFTWGRLTELKENNKGTGVGFSLFFFLPLLIVLVWKSWCLDFLSGTQTHRYLSLKVIILIIQEHSSDYFIIWSKLVNFLSAIFKLTGKPFSTLWNNGKLLGRAELFQV